MQYKWVMLQTFQWVNTRWHIETTTGTVVPDIAANYELVRPAPADVTSSGMIRLHDIFSHGSGTYMLYYTEENSNGCTTVRRFPISLGDPFDADILTVADQCSGADGVVFQNLQDSTTTVNYTIRLNTSSYGSSWRFNLHYHQLRHLLIPTWRYNRLPLHLRSDLQQRHRTRNGTIYRSGGNYESSLQRAVYK